MKRLFFLFFCFLFLHAAVAQAQTQPLQEIIVSTGDSITVGYPYCPVTTADGCAVDYTYVPLLSALSGMPTVNKGRSGAESWFGRYMIDSYLSQYNPQILTIYYGNNDIQYNTAAQDVRDAISNLTYIVNRCLYHGTRPVIATLGPQFGQWAWRLPYIRQINDGIRQLATSRGVAVADIGNSALWGQQSYFWDDIHPNPAGHAVIANLFYQAINRCAYDISPSSTHFGRSGGTGSVSVTSSTGSLCSWKAVSHVDWIVVTGASGGAGSGTVSYQVAYNNTGQERTGTLTIAWRTFTVIQRKAPALTFLPLLLGEE